jgi:hypothetical protein
MKPEIPRRDFLKVAPLTAFALAQTAESAAAAETAIAPQASTGQSQPERPAPFVGIQMGPHTMLDEGIEHTLDLIQESAATPITAP